MPFARSRLAFWSAAWAGLAASWSLAAEPAAKFPPRLAGDEEIAVDCNDLFLKPTETLVDGVAIAKEPPTVEFAYFPGQNYEGRPWSSWGDSLAVDGKYYTSIGDHLSLLSANGDPARAGNALVIEYDPQARVFREIADLQKILQIPAGHYRPGKIHGRLDVDDDGWLYFSTHRGSTRVTTPEHHYKGDWIVRVHLKDGRSEVLAHGPVANHCIPNSLLDPRRKIFYGGTAPGTEDDGGVRFFAFDVNQNKLLFDGPDGPARCMMFAKSTGRLYYVPKPEDGVGPVMRFDPATGAAPVAIDAKIGLRAATQETPRGIIYTIAKGPGEGEATLYAFDVKTERAETLGPAHVGTQTYVTSLDADPTGRYLYYIPGAHGGAHRDGTPVVQYDVKTRSRKVIAFLEAVYQKHQRVSLVGTYSSAVDPDGSKLYVTWNVNRLGGKTWDCTALTVIHIPESERPR